MIRFQTLLCLARHIAQVSRLLWEDLEVVCDGSSLGCNNTNSIGDA
jgi:hypothetical protein